MQSRTVLLFSVVFVLVALGLGTAIGYNISSQRTPTLTETQTISNASIQTVVLLSTTTTTFTPSSKPYPVLTVTYEDVQVFIYAPTCANGNVTYVSQFPVGGESSTVSYIYPDTAPGSSVVTVTTVTTSTNSNETLTQESISC